MVRGGLVFLLAVLAVSGTDRARDLGERGRCERAVEAGRSQWRHDPAPVLDLAIVEVTTLGEARKWGVPPAVAARIVLMQHFGEGQDIEKMQPPEDRAGTPFHQEEQDKQER